MKEKIFQNWCERWSSPKSGWADPLIMGILNVTPDSFYDGGLYQQKDKALRRALELIDNGADIIDIGGESSRPGAAVVSCQEELDRVMPIIEALNSETEAFLSIDTYKPEVMKQAVGAGAHMINDIKALLEPGSLEMAARLQVPVCLMHMQGSPETMQNNPGYERGVTQEVNDFFEQRLLASERAGLPKSLLMIDPGFGFGKSVDHNLELIHKVDSFLKHQRPVVLGVSRKSTIGAILNKVESERLSGSLALTCYAALKGMAMIRTHDVKETRDAFKVLKTLHQSQMKEVALQQGVEA